MTIPKLEEWKESLQRDLENVGNKKDDLLKVISLCENYSREIQSVLNWVSDHVTFVDGIKGEYIRLYRIRFGQDPPLQVKEKPTMNEVLLNTSKARKKAVRDVALAISQPGSEISGKAILEEFTRKAMKLSGSNPNAIIGTILNGFTAEFEKVKGKSGIFKRKGSNA